MKVGDLKRWDAAEYLDTPEMQSEYLNMVLVDGDADEIRDALNVVARAHGMSELAKAAGVSREGLYKTLGEGGNPAFSTVLSIIRALGLKLETSGAEAEEKPAPKRKRKTA